MASIPQVTWEWQPRRGGKIWWARPLINGQKICDWAEATAEGDKPQHQQDLVAEEIGEKEKPVGHSIWHGVL
jgi:hypothetical protein